MQWVDFSVNLKYFHQHKTVHQDADSVHQDADSKLMHAEFTNHVDRPDSQPQRHHCGVGLRLVFGLSLMGGFTFT